MNYQKIYEQLIQKRRNFPINKQKGKPGEVVYHHIIPKCCNGENSPAIKKFNIPGTNIIGLTNKEHYIAHILLERIYVNSEFHTKLVQAKNAIVFSRKYKLKLTARQYENARKDQAIILSNRRKQFNVWNKGKHGLQIPWNKGKKVGYTWNKGIKCKPLTAEHKKSISNGYKGRILVNNGIKTISVYPDKIPDGYVKGRLRKHIS